MEDAASASNTADSGRADLAASTSDNEKQNEKSDDAASGTDFSGGISV